MSLFNHTKREKNWDFISLHFTDVQGEGLQRVNYWCTRVLYWANPLPWILIQVSGYSFIVCYIICQCSGCHEPSLSCAIWASMTDRCLNQSQDQELFIFHPPSLLAQTIIVLPDCCCCRPGTVGTRGVVFSTQVSGLTWINSAIDGGDDSFNHGSDISTWFYIHRNDISTTGDDVSIHYSAVFTHRWRF